MPPPHCPHTAVFPHILSLMSRILANLAINDYLNGGFAPIPPCAPRPSRNNLTVVRSFARSSLIRSLWSRRARVSACRGTDIALLVTTCHSHKLSSPRNLGVGRGLAPAALSSPRHCLTTKPSSARQGVPYTRVGWGLAPTISPTDFHYMLRILANFEINDYQNGGFAPIPQKCERSEPPQL